MMDTSRALLIAVVAALAVALGVGGRASAGAIDPARSTIADTARLTPGATAVRLAGVVHCGSCRTFTLGATVSQRTTGAVGQGGVRCACHGTAERWLLTARAREATRFKPGEARVCVWLLARGADRAPIDAAQWCERVTLRSAET
jgi:hypothetical protein